MRVACDALEDAFEGWLACLRGVLELDAVDILTDDHRQNGRLCGV